MGLMRALRANVLDDRHFDLPTKPPRARPSTPKPMLKRARRRESRLRAERANMHVAPRSAPPSSPALTDTHTHTHRPPTHSHTQTRPCLAQLSSTHDPPAPPRRSRSSRPTTRRERPARPPTARRPPRAMVRLARRRGALARQSPSSTTRWPPRAASQQTRTKAGKRHLAHARLGLLRPSAASKKQTHTHKTQTQRETQANEPCRGPPARAGRRTLAALSRKRALSHQQNTRATSAHSRHAPTPSSPLCRAIAQSASAAR